MSIKIFNGRKYLYQYDRDQKLIIDDEEIVELHLSNTKSENALPIKCYEQNGLKLCDIPNSLLEQSGILTAYAYCKCNGEYTKTSYTFNVQARKKTDDYVEDEEEVKRWSDLDKRISDLENNPVSEEVIEEIVKEYLNENPIEFEVPSEYVTEEELEAKGYLTEHQDLSGYAEKDHTHDEYITDEELSKKGYLTEHQDLSSYALKTEIPKDYAQKEHTHEGYVTADFVTEAINNAINVALNTEV